MVQNQLNNIKIILVNPQFEKTSLPLTNVIIFFPSTNIPSNGVFFDLLKNLLGSTFHDLFRSKTIRSASCFVFITPLLSLKILAGLK